jgi:tRNA(adenine34) deaminase
MLTDEMLHEMMREALLEAQHSANSGEVPVGAVVYCQGKLISRAHNRTTSDNDPTAHAEILALRDAGKKLGRWRLDDAILCVTLEPCTMCAGAIKTSRISTVVYGASEPKTGAVESLYNVLEDPRTGATPRVIRGIQESASQELLKSFFSTRR